VILPDTSVWVDYLRARPPTAGGIPDPSPAESLDALIQQELVLTCGPVVAELLAGARGRGRTELAEQLGAQPWVELGRADWLKAGEVAAGLQERGETVPLVDIQIAICAAGAKAELWTFDGDFRRIAEVLDGLQLRVFEV